MNKVAKEPRSLYFIGIKGIATASIAVMAKQLGYEVQGSDVPEKFPTDELLKSHGIPVHESFSIEHLRYKPDLVVVSTSYGAQNPEVKAIKSLRLKTIAMSEMMGRLMDGYVGIGVTGVHGKTTTTSLVAYILTKAGYSPSYIIGAPSVTGLESAGKIGDGEYFVVEADEYKKADTSNQPKFLDLPLKHIIITSIELDHPDMYQTAEEVYQVFYQLTTKVPRDGSIIACTDWPLVRRLVSRRVDRPCQTYGFDPIAQHQITDVKLGASETTFSLKTATEVLGPFTTKLPGQHNLLNATAAILMCRRLGVSDKAIEAGLRTFEGPARRFQVLGKINGATVVDDYAHHPTAIDFLIKAAKERYPKKRIVVVFQPHTYSRTGRLLKEFAQSLKAADQLILLNIWASAREKSGYVTIKDLIDELKRLRARVEYRSTLEEAATYLKSILSSDDVVLLVGAGDVYKIFPLLRDGDA